MLQFLLVLAFLGDGLSEDQLRPIPTADIEWLDTTPFDLVHSVQVAENHLRADHPVIEAIRSLAVIDGFNCDYSEARIERKAYGNFIVKLPYTIRRKGQPKVSRMFMTQGRARASYTVYFQFPHREAEMTLLEQALNQLTYEIRGEADSFIRIGDVKVAARN